MAANQSLSTGYDDEDSPDSSPVKPKSTRVVPYDFGSKVSKHTSFADCTVEQLQSFVIEMRKGDNAADIRR